MRYNLKSRTMKKLTVMVFIAFGLLDVANAQEEKMSNRFWTRFRLNQYLIGAYMDSLANANQEKYQSLKKSISRRVDEISHYEMEDK